MKEDMVRAVLPLTGARHEVLDVPRKTKHIYDLGHACRAWTAASGALCQGEGLPFVSSGRTLLKYEESPRAV